jgi:Glycosyl transferases group 1
VVASDVPTGVCLVNRRDVTGLLIPPGDPVALAAALKRLLSDQALRQRFGRTARARAEQEFGVEQMATRTMQHYQDVLTRGQAGVAIIIFCDLRLRWTDYPVLDQLLTIFWAVGITDAVN